MSITMKTRRLRSLEVIAKQEKASLAWVVRDSAAKWPLRVEGKKSS